VYVCEKAIKQQKEGDWGPDLHGAHPAFSIFRDDAVIAHLAAWM
jgi:hypothetical protein